MDAQQLHPTASAAPDFANELRKKAEAHDAVQIDLQSIVFQQGRQIARAYVDMMKSYAVLTAQAGGYEQADGRMVVSGFCRIEEEHFGRQPLIVKQKQSILRAKLSELGGCSLNLRSTDLFAAFCTGFAEYCAAEGIRLGSLSLLVRKRDGSRETREFPASLLVSEYAEAIGFPYQIEF